MLYKGPAAEKVIITYDKESRQLKVKQITKFDEIMEKLVFLVYAVFE